MTRKRRFKLIAFLFLSLALFVVAWIWWPLSPVTVIISKETTFVEGPLRADGTIDYVAALNEILSKGVTKDNNALIPLLQALGPAVIPDGANRRSIYAALGMEPLPAKGDYFLDLLGVVKRVATPGENATRDGGDTTQRRAIDDLALTQQHEASIAPWAASDLPWIDGWVIANEKPLAKVHEAAARSHLWLPRVSPAGDPGGPAVIHVAVHAVREQREIAMCLACRAMNRLHRGDIDGAWMDCLAMLRLGRLIGRSGDFIHNLNGTVIEQIGARCVIAVAHHSTIAPPRAAAMIADLQKLPARLPIMECLDKSERLGTLDVVTSIHRVGVSKGIGAAGGSGVNSSVSQHGFDANVALRQFNRYFNRLVEAAEVHDWVAREKLLQQHDDEIHAAADRVKALRPLPYLVESLLLSPSARRQKASQAIADLLTTVMMSSYGGIFQAESDIDARTTLAMISIALASHHVQHGHFPQTIQELSPIPLSVIPSDPFSGRAMVYRPTGNGYLIYSLGRNRQDDQGDASDDHDIVVKFPCETSEK